MNVSDLADVFILSILLSTVYPYFLFEPGSPVFITAFMSYSMFRAAQSDSNSSVWTEINASFSPYFLSSNKFPAEFLIFDLDYFASVLMDVNGLKIQLCCNSFSEFEWTLHFGYDSYLTYEPFYTKYELSWNKAFSETEPVMSLVSD